MTHSQGSVTAYNLSFEKNLGCSLPSDLSYDGFSDVIDLIGLSCLCYGTSDPPGERNGMFDDPFLRLG
jgi:hypothetical protein